MTTTRDFRILVTSICLIFFVFLLAHKYITYCQEYNSKVTQIHRHYYSAKLDNTTRELFIVKDNIIKD